MRQISFSYSILRKDHTIAGDFWKSSEERIIWGERVQMVLTYLQYTHHLVHDGFQIGCVIRVRHLYLIPRKVDLEKQKHFGMWIIKAGSFNRNGHLFGKQSETTTLEDY